MYGVDYLLRLRAAVVEFERAFEAWLETQHVGSLLESRGLFPTVWTSDGVDENLVRQLELDVAAAAGAAARAVQVTGAYLVVSTLQYPVDPIANWSQMSSPKAILDPHTVRTTAATVRGRLDTMLADAEAEAEDAMPGFAPSQLHPLVWSAAANHWTTHQRRVAIREAAEALTGHWRDVLGRKDVDGTKFWEQTLAEGEPQPGRPKMAWPGDDADMTVQNMRHGSREMAKALSHLATGAGRTIRNVTTHAGGELSEQEGFERLAVYSYLARLLDRCEVRRHPDDLAKDPLDGI